MTDLNKLAKLIKDKSEMIFSHNGKSEVAITLEHLNEILKECGIDVTEQPAT